MQAVLGCSNLGWIVLRKDQNSHELKQYAKVVADAFGTEHHELRVSGQSTDLLPAIVKRFDQPVRESDGVVDVSNEPASQSTRYRGAWW
jgi:asparagine synthase